MSTRETTDTADHWFRIDGVHRELRGRSVRSGMLSVAARVAQGLLGIGAVMVLARVLRPADFGVLAMVLPVTLLFNGVANGALQAAIMHEETLDHARASALFRGSALVNLGFAALFAASGPLLARVYDDARASGVAMIWAGVLWFATLGAMHEALLKRQLRFAAVLSARIIGLALGIAAAIVAALLGAGYWALLIQWVVLDVFRTCANWWLCGWRPSLRSEPGARAGTRDLRLYWRNLAGYRLLNWFAMHPDRILVGRLGGATLLGLYDGARRWAFYPAVELFQSLSDVAVATFSRVADDAARYRAIMLRGILPVLALPLPMIAFIFADTRDVILVLLGSQWLDAIPFVRLMCIAAFFGSIARVTQWFYLSRGDTDRQLRWALVAQTPGMLAAVLIGTRWGAIGVATGFTIGTATLTIPGLLYCLSGTPVSARDFAATAARPVFGAAGAGALLLMIAGGLPRFGAALPDMGLRLLVFVAAYGSAWLALPGGRRDTAELLGVLRELRRRPGDAAASG